MKKDKKELETPKFEINLFVDDINTGADPSNTGGNTGEWGGDENVDDGGWI
jgi:hypothetical protein